MNDKPLTIFLSCGTPYEPSQERFLEAVELFLKDHGCIPMTVGRSKFSVKQPVQASRDLIGSCAGAVVIAYERLRIRDALDKPDSPKQQEVRDVKQPTIWNQMEAAMAYGQHVPILTLVQPGLKQEGMLSDRLEWKAIKRELTPDLLRTDEFQQVFDEWFALVKEGNETRIGDGPLLNGTAQTNPAEMNIGDLFKRLRPGQLWGMVVGTWGIAAAIAIAAYNLGVWVQKIQHP